MSDQNLGKFIIYNPTTHTCLFDSNDVLKGDNIIEAHAAIGETRNFFELEKDPHGHYRMKNVSTKRYVFVSNDTKTGDHVVEAHSAQQEDRNSFQLLGVYTPF